MTSLTSACKSECYACCKRKEDSYENPLATDGSPFSDAAVQSLASQFRAEGTEVRVLQVVEPFVFATLPQMSPGYAPEMVARFRDQLKSAKDSVARAKELPQKAGFQVDSRVIENEVRTPIQRVGRVAIRHDCARITRSKRLAEIPVGKRGGVCRQARALLRSDCA